MSDARPAPPRPAPAPLALPRPSWHQLLPIVGRELTSRMRNYTTYVVFGLPPVLQALALLDGLRAHVAGGGAAGVGPSGEAAFTRVCQIEAIAIGLLIPGIAAASFIRERTRGTLPLLAGTGLTAGQVYAGKLAALVLYGLALVAASLPIWLFSLFELQPERFWAWLHLLLWLVLLGSAIGLYWLALAPKLPLAMGLAYATTFWAYALIYGLLPLWRRLPGPQWLLVALLPLGLTGLFVWLGGRAIAGTGLVES